MKQQEGRMVEIPKEMVEEIKSILGRYGYKSLAEFVRDSVRRRIETLEKQETTEIGNKPVLEG